MMEQLNGIGRNIASELPTTSPEADTTTPAISTSKSEHLLVLLSRLLLTARELQRPGPAKESPREGRDEETETGLLRPETFDELLALAKSHHVVLRAFQILREKSNTAKNYSATQRIASEINAEQARVNNALSFLDVIVKTLNDQRCPVTVIKSLDHWPDLGNDLDLYTAANSADVVRVMRSSFKAEFFSRSWGDRLANKWNFLVPGLPEAVEVHIGRLGQTGEQVSLAKGLGPRSRLVQLQDYVFPVASAEDRLIIVTLQRMYRHFSVRLCDIVDTVQLIEEHDIDYTGLRALAEAAGIWEGVATYLSIVSDYVERYRGDGLAIPAFVRALAGFGGNRLSYGRGFLRIPILPDSARLYASELRKFITSRELKSTFRLGLLPCLATAAALQYKITRKDKGIW